MPCSLEEVKINSILAVKMTVDFMEDEAFELGKNR